MAARRPKGSPLYAEFACDLTEYSAGLISKEIGHFPSTSSIDLMISKYHQDHYSKIGG